jgi:hypothetical protein
MIPKVISHTSVQNSTYEFQERNISSIQEIISSIQNYQVVIFLLVTLLVWQICFLNWDLDMDSFMGSLCISFDGPVERSLLVIQGGLSSNSMFYVSYFFRMTSFGA